MSAGWEKGNGTPVVFLWQNAHFPPLLPIYSCSLGGLMLNIWGCYSLLVWDQGSILLPLVPVIRSDTYLLTPLGSDDMSCNDEGIL